jgi:hypothetical protein
MEHQLLKHAQLTKQYQMDIFVFEYVKLPTEKKFKIFEKRISYLPSAEDQLVVFTPGDDNWSGFIPIQKLLESIQWKPETMYSFDFKEIKPDNVKSFEIPEYNPEETQPKEYLKNFLKKYVLHLCVEYEM